jgi:hypothetical protein
MKMVEKNAGARWRKIRQVIKGIVSWNKIEFWRFHHVDGNFLNSRQRI